MNGRSISVPSSINENDIIKIRLSDESFVSKASEIDLRDLALRI